MRQALMSLLAVMALVGCGGPETTDGAGTGTQSGGLKAESAPVAVFNTQLRAENEPNGASTSASKGHAQIKVLADGTVEFTLVINNKGDETFTRAHIHKAPAGSNGGIHWDLIEAGDPVAELSGHPAILRGVARPRAVADLDDLVANPELYYVNAHSPAFPGGAVRGQLD